MKNLEGKITVTWWEQKEDGKGGESSGHRLRGIEDAPTHILSRLSNSISDELQKRSIKPSAGLAHNAAAASN
jgi:hypothetical protein